MRLLVATIDFPPARGGVQKLLERLLERLSGPHELVVVTPRGPAGDRDWDAGRSYRVVRAPAVGWSRLDLALLSARIVVEALRTRPAVIVCGHVLLGPVGRLIGWLLGRPYVVMAYAYEVRAPRMARICRLALGGAARVVTISDFSRRAVEAHGVASGRVSVIRPGAAVGPQGGATEAQLLPRTGPILLSVGRLVDSYKGHDMVIRALPLVLARFPTTRYVIVGDGPLARYLRRIADSVGVADAVVFAGAATDAELDAWYHRCDVFVLAGRESAVSGGAEGFGIVLVEAGLRGKPVVAGRSGGIPDAVVHEETGLLVNPVDVAEIADAIVRLLADRPYAARLGEHGRRRATTELSWDGYADRFQRMLGEAT
jgi:phosphatidylinositol alpha-1,6-mannosyltransferase